MTYEAAVIRQRMEEKLIIAVSARRELYDQGSYNYRRRDLKKEAWISIADEVGLPPDQCKRRWRSLRDIYMREKRKDASKGLAGGLLRTWKYSALLSFLNPFFCPRETGGNMDASMDASPVEDRTEEDDPQPGKEAAVTDPSATVSNVGDYSEPGFPSQEATSLLGLPAAAASPDAGPSSAPAPSSCPSPSSASGASSTAGPTESQRRRKRPREEPVNMDSRILLALKAMPPPPPPPVPHSPSETESFFDCISKMVERLPQMKRDAVKFNIYQIVYEALSAEDNF